MYVKESAKKALKKSIKVWEAAQKILEETTDVNNFEKPYRGGLVFFKQRTDMLIQHGVGDCPLCLLFHSNNCFGCPINKKTKKKYCYNTPYMKFQEHICDYIDSELIRLHQAEIDFLKALDKECKVKEKKCQS